MYILELVLLFTTGGLTIFMLVLNLTGYFIKLSFLEQVVMIVSMGYSVLVACIEITSMTTGIFFTVISCIVGIASIAFYIYKRLWLLAVYTFIWYALIIFEILVATI